MTAGPVTLLFTDLVGSTELAQRLGEEGAEAFRRTHFSLLRNAFSPYGGREVKNLGDGLMVVFDAPSDAVASAVAMQRAVAEHNRSGGEPFAVRVGVQTGEAVQEDGDYFGTPVIVAKRLCDRAVAGQILATAGVAGAHPARDVGALRLKGIAEPLVAVEVMWDGIARTPEPDTAPATLVVRPPSLAPPPDLLVGRDTELAALAGLLHRNRLVTIVGPGGVGKTRLSGHLVDMVATGYPDGVWCCALASVEDDAQVPDAVATVLRVERRAGVDLLDRLVEFLAPKRALLVLDNCEQIVEGAADLSAAVLAGTRGVDVLVTSREALGVAGEHRMPLEPLAVGSGGDPAVTLFIERAASARGSALEGADLGAVRELCRRVDGLPLAIELAAARVTTRSVPEIVADVTDRLTELGVRRGRPDRHRSIHALVDWSYERLDEPDRRLFERMAVFGGGAQLGAVAAVVGEPETRALDRLQSLADQSLVSVRVSDLGTRYALLEPVRAYAEQRLHAESDAARDAHAAYFVGMVERTDAALRGPDEIAWMRRLEQEIANLRAAHTWLLNRDDRRAALRLAGALYWFAINSGVSEVYAWASQTVDRYADTGDPLLAGAYATAGFGAWVAGALERAGELGRCSVEIAAGPSAARFGYEVLGVTSTFRGDFTGGVANYRRAAECSRTAGDTLQLVNCLGGSALALAYGGQLEAACLAADEAIALAHTPTMLAWAHYCAGEVRLETAPAEAAPFLERAAVEAEQADNRFILGTAGMSLVSVHTRLGRPAAALPHYPRLIDHWQRFGAWTQQWLTLRNLIEALAGTGRPEAAAVLYGAMTASTTASPLVGADAVRLAGVLDVLAVELGDEPLTNFRKDGATLGDAGAVAYAREVLREILDEP